ncbi:hypothetical protein C7999DRAFT_40385 [Corynascus novoguineensis]|uniref:D-isomer specific 2-hydroxyacid dehydrogenase NAD-binding domain-containing protein n=1 Tax=Corynascus novoguineensis TaxID=1126955 RepID=A0AAN7HQ31_9PEZI|nr:hypothetical protein C7999DRAFT_40385 [Corynascus novoguineensis]
MARSHDPTLTEAAVRVDPRDSREYAGCQEASPLYDICHHPERFSKVLYHDQELLVLDDANAKSPDHVILMPRDTSIKEIACLRTEHLPLLYRFRGMAQAEIDRVMRIDPGKIPMFRVGFHTIPSLFPLHCHVLDCSLSTEKMFHARHWKVTFSNMFIALDRVIEEVKRTGRMTVDADGYRHDWVTRPIRCPVDIKQLARHWRQHVDEWKSTKSLALNVTPARHWEPTYPVILTTRKHSGFLGLVGGNELDNLRDEFPGLEVYSYYTDEWSHIPKYVLDKVTIYLSTTELPPAEYALPQLEWIQLASSGLDLLTRHPYNHRPGLRVTSRTGSGSEAIAEWVLMNAMFLSRRMPRALQHQARREWAPAGLTSYRTLGQLSVGIVGFGSIGQQVAERFLALGAKGVAAVNPKGLPPSLAAAGTKKGSRLGEIAVLRAGVKEALREFLGQQDVLVLAAPLRPETRGLIGGAELAALPRGAIVLNVSRGPLLDEHLGSGHLAGAAIGVADQEPLDVTSPLWDLPNLIITPHISAFHDKYNQNMLSIFEHNLQAHLEHKPITAMWNVAQLPVPSDPLPPPSLKSNLVPRRTTNVVYAVRERPDGDGNDGGSSSGRN